MLDARTHGCENCRNRSTLEQVGKPEFKDFFGGKAQEEVARYQCSTCGAKWLHREESGLGGHGDFWEPDEGQK